MDIKASVHTYKRQPHGIDWLYYYCRPSCLISCFLRWDRSHASPQPQHAHRSVPLAWHALPVVHRLENRRSPVLREGFSDHSGVALPGPLVQPTWPSQRPSRCSLVSGWTLAGGHKSRMGALLSPRLRARCTEQLVLWT